MLIMNFFNHTTTNIRGHSLKIAFSWRAILSTYRVLPPAAVTERKSGIQVQYSAPFDVYSIGSQAVLDQKRCCYGACKSNSRYADGRIWTVFSP